MRRRVKLIARALVTFVASTLVFLGPAQRPAFAATCHVTNLTVDETSVGNGANLQTAIDDAGSGDRLEVRGVCHGNFKIRKDLRLIGRPTASHPKATLDADGSGRVLMTQADVTIRSIRIRDGHAKSGGGIQVRDGTLELGGIPT